MEKLLTNDEREGLNQLRNKFTDPPLTSKKIILFYPGCGWDLLKPLAYINLLHAGSHVEMHFLDKDIHTGAILKTLHDLNIDAMCEHRRDIIYFHFHEKDIELHFHQQNAFDEWPVEEVDIHIERGFQLFRKEEIHYENAVISHLKEGGVLISDWPFNNPQLKLISEKHGKELGFYPDLFIYEKH